MRERRGSVSQQQVADMAGVSQAVVSLLENDRHVSDELREKVEGALARLEAGEAPPPKVSTSVRRDGTVSFRWLLPEGPKPERLTLDPEIVKIISDAIASVPQHEFARIAGVSQASVSRFLGGIVNQVTAGKILKTALEIAEANSTPEESISR